MPNDHARGCLCGAARCHHAGPLRDIVASDCRQCGRTSGHFFMATSGTAEGISVLADDRLQWCESSPGVSPGFRNRCGSSLSRTRTGSGRISIMAGTLDEPTGLGLPRQIPVADRGDYIYCIDPDLPWAEDGNPQEEEP